MQFLGIDNGDMVNWKALLVLSVRKGNILQIMICSLGIG